MEFAVPDTLVLKIVEHDVDLNRVRYDFICII